MTVAQPRPDRLADFVFGLRWETLPEAVKHQARRCLLDLLGCAVAGTSTGVARSVRQFVVDMGGTPEASVLGARRRVPLPWAVLVNAFATSALDADDGFRPVKGHPGAFVFPAALGAAEMTRATGRELLEALVVGYEVAMRAGLASHAQYADYHGSGSWGGQGSCAAAAHLLRCGADVLAAALGTAGYHAAITPMMRGIDAPAMVKDGIGWGAFTGVASLRMAQHGFTGTPSLLSGPGADPLIATLGTDFLILRLYFKRYACCRWAQPAIHGALRIADAHELRPSDISRITVHTFAEATRLTSRQPHTTEEAQFSLPFPVALALVRGRVGPDEVRDEALADPVVLALAERVEMVAEPRFQEAFPARALAEVEVVTVDGRRLGSGPVQAAGDADDPLGDAEVDDKFFEFAAAGLPLSDARRLRELALDCEKLASVQPILDVLARVKA